MSINCQKMVIPKLQPVRFTVSANVSRIKCSIYKARIVADFIRDGSTSKKAYQILDELRFVKKRVAQDFYKLLKSCMHNAQNNNGLNLRNLVISEVYVNKDLCLKRREIRGRGRSGLIVKPFIKLFISVCEAQ